MNIKSLITFKWTARIISLVFFLLILPFYFGYGNPLPFVNPDYSWIENVWLLFLPLSFIGLLAGWKYEKIGGYLIILPIILGFILGLLADAKFPINMFILFIPGILYLIVGYKRNK